MLAWDEFDKSFYVLENSINIKIEDLLFIEKQKQIILYYEKAVKPKEKEKE